MAPAGRLGDRAGFALCVIEIAEAGISIGLEARHSRRDAGIACPCRVAKDLVWELEKLRRRFDVDGDELRAAAKRLSRKRRGEPAFIDDEHLAQMRAGASAREVAKNIGGAYRDNSDKS